MANIISPRAKKRKAQLELNPSDLLHGAQIWKLTLIQNTSLETSGSSAGGALKVTFTYRTVFEVAVFVIARIPPILTTQRAVWII